MKRSRFVTVWFALLACLLSSTHVAAGVIGSGIYAPNCNDYSSRVSVEIFGDGSAEVLANGLSFRNLMTSYAFFGDETPQDFHTAVLFDGPLAPIGAGEGDRRWLEIWLDRSGFSVRPNGDAANAWQFCENLPTGMTQVRTGFDCAFAQGSIEIMICADNHLGELNYKMMKAFRSSEQRARGRDFYFLQEEQRDWVARRNTCWDSVDRRECIEHETMDRTAILSARYDLIRAGRKSRYRCVSWEGEWVTVTPYPTNPETLKIARGAYAEIGIRHAADAGAKYLAESGVSFWMDGDQGLLEWPSHKLHRCWRR